MSVTADQMELREADIEKHYAAALALLQGFDHTPRVAKGREASVEKIFWHWHASAVSIHNTGPCDTLHSACRRCSIACSD